MDARDTQDSNTGANATASNRFSRVHLLIFGSMLTVVGMLAWTTWSARALVVTFVPQVHAATQARVSVTEAHLWLEEIVSGDTSEDPQQVWDKIAEADWHLAAMLNGAEKDGRVIVAVEEPLLRADLLQAQATLKQFTRLGHARIDGASAPAAPVPVAPESGSESAAANPAPTDADPAAAPADEPAAATTPVTAAASMGVGSDIDAEFDDAFTRFFDATLRTEKHLQLTIDKALGVFLVTQIALMAAVALIFVWILWLLIRKEALDRDEHYSSLQASFDQLRQSQHELERQNALRGAMVELADAMQGKNTRARVAQAAVDALCARTGASAAVFWICVPGAGLERVASYALPAERVGLTALAEGEGLAGRAALDQQVVAIDVPSNFLPVSSGLGRAPAPHLRVLPLVHDRVTAGVLEFAFIDAPDEYVTALLAVAAPAIAVRLQMAGGA